MNNTSSHIHKGDMVLGTTLCGTKECNCDHCHKDDCIHPCFQKVNL